MPASYLNLNGAKIAPFKYPSVQPYGSFANTTPVGSGDKEYRIQQSIDIDGKSINLNWPSSEHAYHAQKIIHLKGKLDPQDPAQHVLTKMLNEIEATNEEFLPRKHYDGLVNRYLPELNQNGLNVQNKRAFDALCDADYHTIHNPNGGKKSIDFMRIIIQLKLAQHPDLAMTAIECAKDGVLPVEVSQYDNNWASGPDGKGENMLGILILEEGNKLLRQQKGTPAIPNPLQAYQSLKSNQNLSHNNLVEMIEPSMSSWVIPPTVTPSVVTPNPMPNQGHPQTQQYYVSTGGNQRLVIKQNQVIGYEFRVDSSRPWQPSGAPSRFQGLVTAFTKQQKAHTPHPQQIQRYYVSTGGNQRLVINQNNVVGYEFRIDSQHPWQESGDPSRFKTLKTAFNNELINNLKPYYKPATLGKGRNHLWEATSFKTEHQALKGDALKTKILIGFKFRLKNCSTLLELQEQVKEIKKSEEYKVLAQAQGMVTSLFNLKTSSLEALEHIIEEKNSQLGIGSKGPRIV